MKTADNVERVLYCLRACKVERWHNETVLQTQNVGNHMARVAIWITLFHPDPSANLLKSAVWHDLEEKITGDIPHWAKAENPKIKIAVSEVEAAVRREYNLGFELSDADRIWLNSSDLFDAFLHMWQEVKMLNNRWMFEDYERCSTKIIKYKSAGYFPDDMFSVFVQLRDYCE